MSSKIPTEADINRRIEELISEIEENFENEVEKLKDEIQVMTPVKTGALRSAYSEVLHVGKFRYRIINNMNYAYNVLIKGNKHGQLPQGVVPHIRMWRKSISGGNN